MKTSIGPAASLVLCGDDLNGEIYAWRWVEAFVECRPQLGAF